MLCFGKAEKDTVFSILLIFSIIKAFKSVSLYNKGLTLQAVAQLPGAGKFFPILLVAGSQSPPTSTPSPLATVSRNLHPIPVSIPSHSFLAILCLQQIKLQQGEARKQKSQAQGSDNRQVGASRGDMENEWVPTPADGSHYLPNNGGRQGNAAPVLPKLQISQEEPQSLGIPGKLLKS